MDDHPIDVWSEWHRLVRDRPLVLGLPFVWAEPLLLGRRIPHLMVDAELADSFAILGHVNDHPVD